MSAKSRYNRGARGIDSHGGSSRYVGKHVNPGFHMSPSIRGRHHPFLTKNDIKNGAIDVEWGPRGGPVLPIIKPKPKRPEAAKPAIPSAILSPSPTEKTENKEKPNEVT